jgi:hypothetical protein
MGTTWEHRFFNLVLTSSLAVIFFLKMGTTWGTDLLILLFRKEEGV